jgi:hypothetical protein
MSAASAPRGQRPETRVRPARTPAPPAMARSRARTSSRRRRELHFRRRRRDLLEDTGLALLMASVLVSVTAGLGVLLLLEIPVGLVLIGSSIAERRSGRRREPQ